MHGHLDDSHRVPLQRRSPRSSTLQWDSFSMQLHSSTTLMSPLADKPDTPVSALPDVEPEKMRGARDARVVVPYRLFALPAELLVRQVQVLGHELPQILFNGFLIL